MRRNTHQISLLLVLLLWLITCGIGHAAIGYTNPKAFAEAVDGYLDQICVTFDDQEPSTPIDSIKTASVSAVGLDSDGTSKLELKLIATQYLPMFSKPNAMGTASEFGEQFLAGNGDSISFDLEHPVYAFGLYLIGNPSPTGEPPIPFWRMVACGPRGTFTAYSDTKPFDSLGEGNDLYFLGIVSADNPFQSIQLFSDNDAAAVYSFNVDDIVTASLPDEVPLIQTKRMLSGTMRVNAIVTRVHKNRFNIETADRTAGISVIGNGAVRGKDMWLLGSVGASEGGERVINLSKILSQVDSIAPTPFFMNSLSIGGATSVGAQAGIKGSIGPNNIGLDVAICGRITAIASDFSWITVDDGAGRISLDKNSGVVVTGETNASQRYIGEFVIVRGSSTVFVSDGTVYPAVRVAQATDMSQ